MLSYPVVKKGQISLNKPAAFADAGLLNMYYLLLPPVTKGLRELNMYETKNCKIKVCELDLKN